MLSRSSLVVRKVLPRTVASAFSSEATAEATSVTLNFSVPYESIYSGAKVSLVIIPGVEGEYGVTANHVPYVAQLKPGVLQVMFEDSGSDSEKYCVAGGYAFTHSNSVTVSLYYLVLFPSEIAAMKIYALCFLNVMFFLFSCVTLWSW